MSTPDPQPPVLRSPEPTEWKPPVTFDASHDAFVESVAYERGRRDERDRCAALADAESSAIIEASKRGELTAGISVSRRIAAAIRSEADTPGTA